MEKENTQTERYAGILGEMIRVETVSLADQETPEKSERFFNVLKTLFPRLFETVETERFGGSLLLRWKGKDSTLEPVLLMSHHDTVEATGAWSHPPFAGEVADGRIWGRGTLDTKGNLWAMLQAAEELLAEGFIPARDVWFESACDEETGGRGADAISKELKRRGTRFLFSLDEGGMMLYDPIGGADGVFAMVGVGEKGFADLRFTARSRGGHASAPGTDTPLVRLGRFMAAADRSGVFPAKVTPEVEEMFRRVAPFTKGPQGKIFARPEKFRPLLRELMPRISPTAGAMLKTTLAFTMAQGSQGRNVLPQEAWVVGNMRFSHHQGREGSIRAISKLAAKYGVETEVLELGFDSPVTDCNGAPFRLVERVVSRVFPGVVSLPYIMTGASDSRFFSRVSEHNLRFAPFRISQAQLDSIHGVDENLDLETLVPAVEFYRTLLKELPA